MEAEIRFEGFTPACIEVTASDSVHSDNVKVPVSGARPYAIAIAFGKDWSRTWTITAEAREVSCDGPVVSTTQTSLEVPYGRPTHVTLTLVATDEDRDGYVRKPAGSDCDDTSAMVSPAAVEVCSNGVDDDCSGAADCADGTCIDKECSPSAPCRPDAGFCRSGSCTQVFAPMGASCGAGRACRDDGVCVNADSELNCSDGVDNDSDDAGIDCLDSDCADAGCNAGLCQVNGRCGGGACVGAPKDCGSPTQCRDAGVCNPTDGSCMFPPSPTGTSCDDGMSCSSMDRCNGAGACVGTLACAGGTCRAAFCDGGVCDTARVSGGSCNDGNACSSADTCMNGTCAGSMYTCTPGACQMGGACDGLGGCAFAALPNGTSCPMGACADGGCVPTFPYAPSNLDLAQVPPQGDVLINCRVTFDSTDAGASSWCSGPAPAIYSVTQTGSTEPAMVLSMRRLTLTADGGQLRLVGARPVVLLIWDPGITSIDGLVDARTTKGDAGAGADRPSCGLQSGQPGLTVGNSRGSGGGGGGFTTGGTPGAPANGDLTPGGDGGIAAGVSFSPLIGGCPGGRGGLGMGSGGVPGSGGGAVQISVAGTLRLGSAARLTVSGGGGAAVLSSTRSGGGGGASGGMLLLEGNVLDLSANAWLTANGGAGAEAADDNSPGDLGDDGFFAASTIAQGGSGLANDGSDGADGAAAVTSPGAAQTNKDCGGGGGGATGRIYLRAQSSCSNASNASPPATHDGGCT